MNRRSGMTLVEVTFCMALLAVGFLVAATTIANGQRVARESMERAHARKAAEARLSELRTLLHRASWTDASLNAGDAQTVHDTQFQLLIDQHAQTSAIDLVDDTAGAARIPATLATYVFASDEAALALPLEVGDAGGLDLADVDLDGNGSTTDGSVDLADLKQVAVKIEVTWRPGGWKAGDPNETLRLIGLIY